MLVRSWETFFFTCTVVSMYIYNTRLRHQLSNRPVYLLRNAYVNSITWLTCCIIHLDAMIFWRSFSINSEGFLEKCPWEKSPPQKNAPGKLTQGKLPLGKLPPRKLPPSLPLIYEKGAPENCRTWNFLRIFFISKFCVYKTFVP